MRGFSGIPAFAGITAAGRNRRDQSEAQCPECHRPGLVGSGHLIVLGKPLVVNRSFDKLMASGGKLE